MPSPFPGMNPYLEQTSCWEMLHHQLCGSIATELVAQLRPRYLVKLEHRLYIHEKSAEERRFFGTSDVGVSRIPERPSAATAAVHVEPPTYGMLPRAVEIEKQAYIEIIDRESATVVTAIEILSPTNKRPGADREQYLAKRRSILHSLVHLVEIDLLRGGPRMPIDDLPDCDYCAVVSRSYERPRVGIWPWRIRDPIPEIPVPVHEGDNDARLDLKPLIDRVHDELGFADYIYEGAPEPRLSADDLAWAEECLNQNS